MFKELIKNQNKKNFILILFFVHQIFYSLKASFHWDDIGTIWAAGKFIEKLKITVTDFNNPLLSNYTGEEFYGVFASLPVHILTRATSSISFLSNLLIEVNVFSNEFDYYFFLRHFFLTLYVVALLLIISRKIQKESSAEFSFWFVLLLCLYPSFNGHSIFNMTDIPLALNMFTASIFYISYFYKLPKVYDLPVKTSLIVGFLFGSCLLIRATSLIFLFPLFLFILLRIKNARDFSKFLLSNFKIMSFAFLFYFLGSPSMWRYPLKYINTILSYQFDNPWRGVTLTNGTYVDAVNPPISYLATWFLYKTPILILFFIVIALFKLKTSTKDPLKNFSIFIIIYTFSLHVIFSPLTYNGIRHYLFLVPFLIYLSTHGFFHLYEKTKKYKILILIPTLIYLIFTQISYDQYKYVYFNELTPTQGMSEYCEDINGCGNWILDYWGLSGKESAKMLEKYNFEHLYICSPQFTTTVYMDHSEIDIDNFWYFKNGVPVYNETSGFDQYELIYSEGHFKNAIKNENISKMHVHSIYLPHKPMDTCNFFQIENQFDINCEYLDSVSRNIRSSEVYFSFLSECTFTKITN